MFRMFKSLNIKIEDIDIETENSSPPSPILIVEDNSFNVIAIQAVLDEFGLTDTELAMKG